MELKELEELRELEELEETAQELKELKELHETLTSLRIRVGAFDADMRKAIVAGDYAHIASLKDRIDMYEEVLREMTWDEPSSPATVLPRSATSHS